MAKLPRHYRTIALTDAAYTRIKGAKLGDLAGASDMAVIEDALKLRASFPGVDHAALKIAYSHMQMINRATGGKGEIITISPEGEQTRVLMMGISLLPK